MIYFLCFYDHQITLYMYVKHALLDLHVYHALNVRLTCVLKNTWFSMLHIFLCNSNNARQISMNIKWQSISYQSTA